MMKLHETGVWQEGNPLMPLLFYFRTKTLLSKNVFCQEKSWSTPNMQYKLIFAHLRILSNSYGGAFLGI